MFRYAKKTDYDLGDDRNTKTYQYAFLRDWLPRYSNPTGRILEIGANDNLYVLSGVVAAEKWIADPYEGLGGAATLDVPAIPPEYRISRCLVGVDSFSIPSDHFDVIFSLSVLEHVGQAEVNYDCNFTANPPPEQELPRQALTDECFRLLKPGGITIHTIDHGVRNISYHNNFTKSGFDLLIDEPVFDHTAMLADENALRQRTMWDDINRSMPQVEQLLHTVMLLGYRKPYGVATRHPERIKLMPEPSFLEPSFLGRVTHVAKQLLLRIARK